MDLVAHRHRLRGHRHLEPQGHRGFTRLGPSIVVLVGYVGSFWCVSQTLDTIPLGVAYAVWSGVGIAALAVVTVVVYDQKLDAAALVGMGLIIAVWSCSDCSAKPRLMRAFTWP